MGAELERGLDIMLVTGWVLLGINLYLVINYLIYTFIANPEEHELAERMIAIFFPAVYVFSRIREYLNNKINEF